MRLKKMKEEQTRAFKRVLSDHTDDGPAGRLHPFLRDPGACYPSAIYYAP